MEKLITFKKVSKSFGDLEVFSALSFSVNSQDIIGILGPSGVGKSTILKMIARLETPSGGEIVNKTKRPGYVFQEHRLLPWKTTLENVSLPIMVSGIQKKEAYERAAYFLEKMGLSGFEDYYPS